MLIDRYKKTVEEKIFFVCGEEKAASVMKKRRRTVIIVSVSVAVCFVIMFLSGRKATSCLLYSVCFELSFFILRDVRLFKQAKNRCLHMRFELSEILDRLAVLLDAGVTLWNAVSIVSEREISGGAFEEELKRTVNGFMSADGYFFEPESAFEELSARCNDAAVSTFVSLIVQNSRKGTGELAELLRIQAVNARNERRLLAKQLSDEASTLMLIPSALILAAVLVIVAAPAVIQFL